MTHFGNCKHIFAVTTTRQNTFKRDKKCKKIKRNIYEYAKTHILWPPTRTNKPVIMLNYRVNIKHLKCMVVIMRWRYLDVEIVTNKGLTVPYVSVWSSKCNIIPGNRTILYRGNRFSGSPVNRGYTVFIETVNIFNLFYFFRRYDNLKAKYQRLGKHT